MSPILQSYVSLAGRILVSSIFLLSGFLKIANWAGTAAEMERHGMPAVTFFLTAATVVEIVGGLALLLGFQTRFAALILFLYLIPVTPVMHNFWAVTGPAQQGQLFHFLKNLAIMGGLLLLTGFGPGWFSFDAWRRRAV